MLDTAYLNLQIMMSLNPLVGHENENEYPTINWAARLIWCEVTLFVCLLYKFHVPGNMPIESSRAARLN